MVSCGATLLRITVYILTAFQYALYPNYLQFLDEVTEQSARLLLGRMERTKDMGYWDTCKNQGCNSRVYMAEVIPQNESRARWLPFEDELLSACHLEYCTGTKPTWHLVKCPFCHRKYRACSNGTYRCDNPRCKEKFHLVVEQGIPTVTAVR